MKTIQELDYTKVLKGCWKYRRQIIKYGVIGGLVGIIIAFSIPKEYTSGAKIVPEEESDNVSGSMGMIGAMVGLKSAAGGAGVGTLLYPEIVSSSPFLMELSDMEVENNGDTKPMHEYVLEDQKQAWWTYITGLPKVLIGMFQSDDGEEKPFAESPKNIEDYEKFMRQRISISLDKETNVMSISVTLQNPRIATQVLDSVIVNLQSYMQNYLSAKTRATLASNIAMRDDIKVQYLDLGARYAASADESRLITKESVLLETKRLKTELDLVSQLYEQASAQVGATQLKLHDEQTIITVIQPPIEPINSSSPNKPFTVILWGFLGGLIAVGKVVLRELKA